MEPGGNRRRFFIVTAGRTGSTLLATILADAGADFAMSPRDDWDIARGGWMEHAEIRRAAGHFRLAFERSPVKPPTFLSKSIWAYHRAAGKRYLAQALGEATYVKALNLDLAIPFAIKLGYFPQIIVNYRSFGDQALSLSQMMVNWSAEDLAATHNRTYRNALLLIHSYGGCVVSYADLTDRTRTAWAQSLGQITGLSAEKLLASRDRQVSARRAPASQEVPIFDESAQRATSAIDGLAGRVLPPSPQALRNWERKQADRPAGPRRRWVDRLKIETEVLWKSARDRRVPWYARVVAPLCALAYIIAPIDPIPNSLRVIGHLDDVLVGLLLIALFVWLTPSSIKSQHRSAAAERRQTLSPSTRQCPAPEIR